MNSKNTKYIVLVIISIVIVVSLLVFGIIYSFSNKNDNNNDSSIREEQIEQIEKELQEKENEHEGFIEAPDNPSDEVQSYWEKDRQPITQVRVESLIENTLKDIGRLDFTEAQNNVDNILSEYDVSNSKEYENNYDLFLDLVVMSNYNDLYGVDDENIIKQIKNCRDERIILASTLKLEPNLYQYIIQSPDSILPVIGDDISFGELKDIDSKEEVVNLLESILPFANKYTQLNFESDGITYQAYFAHAEDTVRLLYIIDEPSTGRLDTIKDWGEFFERFEEKKEDENE